MSLAKPKIPSGPIPGANYTSDTRNWPWHRPPDITNLDEALEYLMTRLTETSAGKRYMSLISTGVKITTITDMVVTMGVGRGKFTPDFAILLAGPVARMLEIMAKTYDVEYDLGIDKKDTYTNAVTYREIYKLGLPEEESEEDQEVEEEEVSEEPQGLMSAVSEEEQSSMLGYDVEEELEEDE
jgi:hypothetical protein